MKDTILIVEDDRDILEVVTIMLGREGFKVLKATNGKEAIEGVSKKPDLIILDVMLPDMDGFTVCRRIREESLAPVLFLTAKTGVQDKTEGLEAGGDDYLVKPFFQEELLARIRALLRRYEKYRGKEQTEARALSSRRMVTWYCPVPFAVKRGPSSFPCSRNAPSPL